MFKSIIIILLSLIIVSAGQITIDIEDTYISKSNNLINYSESKDLHLNYSLSDESRIVLKFDLSKVPDYIISAKIRIYVKSNYNSGINGPKSLYKLGSDWEKDIVTWSNCPIFYNQSIVTNTNNVVGTWEEYDITEAIQDMHLKGFLLRFNNYSPDYGVIYSSSNDDNNKPELVIIYESTNISNSIKPSKYKVLDIVKYYDIRGRLINSNNKGLVIKKHKCISKIIRCK